jgi:hypothetical protein
MKLNWIMVYVKKVKLWMQTYIASAPATWTTSADSSRGDDATVIWGTYAVGYDIEIHIIQSFTDTTSCEDKTV